MTKRIITLLLALILVIGAFAGCEKKETKTDKKEKTEQTEKADETEEPADTDEPEETEAPEPEEDVDSDGVPLMLWRVYDDYGNEIYLMGTIHLGDKRNDVIIEAVSDELEECDALAVEFDLVAFGKDLKAQTKMIKQFLYSDGTTIADHVSPELYDSMVGFVDENSTYMKLYDYYNVAFWSILVDNAVSECSGLDSDKGIDRNLILRAYDLDLPVYDIESPEFQYDMLNSFDDELNILSIRSVIDEGIDKCLEEEDELYEAYLSGDTEAVEKVIEYENEEYESFTPEEIELIEDYSNTILTERNEGMTEKALSYLENGEKVFFAVGCAHVVGEDGILQALTDAGYHAEKIG